MEKILQSMFPTINTANLEPLLHQQAQRDGMKRRYLKSVSKRLEDEGIEVFINLNMSGTNIRIIREENSNEVKLQIDGLDSILPEELETLKQVLGLFHVVG